MSVGQEIGQISCLSVVTAAKIELAMDWLSTCSRPYEVLKMRSTQKELGSVVTILPAATAGTRRYFQWMDDVGPELVSKSNCGS